MGTSKKHETAYTGKTTVQNPATGPGATLPHCNGHGRESEKKPIAHEVKSLDASKTHIQPPPMLIPAIDPVNNPPQAAEAVDNGKDEQQKAP